MHLDINNLFSRVISEEKPKCVLFLTHPVFPLGTGRPGCVYLCGIFFLSTFGPENQGKISSSSYFYRRFSFGEKREKRLCVCRVSESFGLEEIYAPISKRGGLSFGFGNENQPAAGLCVSRSAGPEQFRKVVVVDASGHVKVGRAIDAAPHYIVRGSTRWPRKQTAVRLVSEPFNTYKCRGRFFLSSSFIFFWCWLLGFCPSPSCECLVSFCGFGLSLVVYIDGDTADGEMTR